MNRLELLAVIIVALCINSALGLAQSPRVLYPKKKDTLKNQGPLSIPIYGNLTGLMYYYVEVYVGDPKAPSKQSLILDTGSTVTCFPCQGTCQKWGKHQYEPFDLLNSESKKIVGWKDIDGCDCGSKGQCLFTQSYDEGSTYEGFYVKDYFQFFPDLKIQESPTYTFGWVTKETNLFFSQNVNGIMGLGQVPQRELFPPVFYSFFRSHYTDELQFTLCFGKNGGQMFIGKYDTSLFANPSDTLKWLPITKDDSYIVELKDYKVGTASLPGTPKRARIDSGVSMTYFTKKQKAAIEQAIKSQCKAGEYKCLGIEYSPGCYKFIENPSHTLKDIFLSYPIISFSTPKDQELKWYPSDYFYNKKDNIYCLAIDPFSNDKDTIVFGAAFIRQNMVVFDIKNKQIGFVRAECSHDPYMIYNENEVIEYNSFHPNRRAPLGLIKAAQHIKVNTVSDSEYSIKSDL